MTVEATIVGDWQHAEFESITCGMRSFERHCSVESALSSPARHAAGLVVLLQPRRDVFSQPEADALRVGYALAVPVLVYGSLCEGECRSGRPLLGWNRLPWYRWIAEYERYSGGDSHLWRQDSRSVGGAALDRLSWTAGGLCRSVAVVGRSAGRLETTCEALRLLGHDPHVIDVADLERGEPLPAVTAALVVGDSLDAWLAGCVNRLRRFRRLERLVVTLNFPRAFEAGWLRRRSGERVRIVAQPFELFELQLALACSGAATGAARVVGGQRRTA